ncbi:hypothetical protein [Pseudomonas moorei]|uniref:hypothetical protein n=1 Tax=Pseudomonas moorei TaxID=395599 RepID=UPI00200CD340|nr:hypothetical protein [Pseudomonas moorei]
MHLAYTKLDMMLEHLKNCSVVKNRAPLKHGGPWGRIYMMGEIFGIMRNPEIYIHAGTLSAKDMEKFPHKLRQNLITLHKYVFIFWAVMMCLGLVAWLGLV